MRALVEPRFGKRRLGLGDAQIAFGQRAAFEQQLAALEPVDRERIVGNGGKKLTLGLDDCRRAQFRDRLAGLHRLIGRDQHFLDQAAGGGGDNADLLLRNGDRAGQRQVGAATFALYQRRSDAGSSDAAVVHWNRDIGGRLSSPRAFRVGGIRRRDGRWLRGHRQRRRAKTARGK